MAKNGKKKQEIVYEESSSSSLEASGIDTQESMIINDSLNSSNEPKAGECCCTCHGMYSNNLLETIADVEIQKVKK